MNNDNRYADVNAREYPPLTQRDASHMARSILRRFGSPNDAAFREGWGAGPRLAARDELREIFNRYATRGTRRCWASTKPTRGHDKGLGRLIHDLSHVVHEFRHPKFRPHDGTHAPIERAIADYAVEMGWLTPKPPRPKITTEQRRAARYCRLAERHKSWEKRYWRAETMLRKIKRQMRALERLQRNEVHF